MNKHLAMGLSLLPVIVLAVGMIGWVLTLRADLDTVIDAWESEDIEVVINSMDAELTQKIDDIRQNWKASRQFTRTKCRRSWQNMNTWGNYSQNWVKNSHQVKGVHMGIIK